MLECLKPLEDWEPEWAKEKLDEIMNDIYDEAGVSKELWDAAKSRVYYDGWHGPISAQEWIDSRDDDETTKAVAKIQDALKIIEKGMGVGIGDIEFSNPDYPYDEDDEGNSINNCVIEGQTIRNEIFAWYFQIYGR